MSHEDDDGCRTAGGEPKTPGQIRKLFEDYAHEYGAAYEAGSDRGMDEAGESLDEALEAFYNEPSIAEEVDNVVTSYFETNYM